MVGTESTVLPVIRKARPPRTRWEKIRLWLEQQDARLDLFARWRWGVENTFLFARCRACTRLWMVLDHKRRRGCSCGSMAVVASQPKDLGEKLRMILRLAWR